MLQHPTTSKLQALDNAVLLPGRRPNRLQFCVESELLGRVKSAEEEAEEGAKRELIYNTLGSWVHACDGAPLANAIQNRVDEQASLPLG